MTNELRDEIARVWAGRAVANLGMKDAILCGEWGDNERVALVVPIIAAALDEFAEGLRKALRQEKLDRKNENEMNWSEINDLRSKRDVLEKQIAAM